MTEPQPGIIVSDGRIDFLVHDSSEQWVYGVRYPTENRGNVKAGDYQLVKVTHETWREVQEQITETVEA